MIILCFLSLWALGVGARLVQVQIVKHDEYRSGAKKRERSDTIKSPRGQILDRNGRVLAISVPSMILAADPLLIDDPAQAAKDISKAIKVNVAALTEQIRNAKDEKNRNLVIARDVDADTVQLVNRELVTPGLGKPNFPKYKGLVWKTESRRSYPHGSAAAQLLGHMKDDKGAAGIERSQEKLLAPRESKREWLVDGKGRPYEEDVEYAGTASDVVLTIDLGIQNIAEQALERAVKSSGSRSGVAIVTNPKNGEILAMANYPTFDPNRITPTAQVFTKNLAVETHYDPGSVFKVVTYGAGLEKGQFTPDDEIDLGNGTMNVGGKTWSAKGGGRVTYSQGLASSNNICAIKTGIRVGDEGLFTMAQKMGFGAKTGIELPAEAPGILAHPSTWKPASIGSKSVGYENSASPLQILGAFATIANDGNKVRPHLIKEIRHSDDKPVDVTQVESTQAFTAETARSLRVMLKQVVVAGTAKRAQVDGYSVAGKTGTAWKYDSTTKTATGQKLMSSFVGMAPADSPELVIAVVLDEPKNGGRDAGLVAAPVFSEIAQAALKRLNITPDQPGKPKVAIIEPKATDKKPEVKPSEAKKEASDKPRPVEPKKTEKKPEPTAKEKAKPKSDPPAKRATPNQRTSAFVLPQRQKPIQEG